MVLFGENLPPFMTLFGKTCLRSWNCVWKYPAFAQVRGKYAELNITWKAAVPPHMLLYWDGILEKHFWSRFLGKKFSLLRHLFFPGSLLSFSLYNFQRIIDSIFLFTDFLYKFVNPPVEGTVNSKEQKKWVFFQIDVPEFHLGTYLQESLLIIS
jgi:hypothetical protein